eukprot:GILI01030263.1.p1 GENE.GILI01030263.1~~GILI01030263.1.p1  ORF type:complete len:456 (-),score=77.75 GILI01030263.1:118-1485(-)
MLRASATHLRYQQSVLAVTALTTTSSMLMRSRLAANSNTNTARNSMPTSLSTSQQIRHISWGGIVDGVKKVLPIDRTTKPVEQVVEEHPEIFENQPVEVDDYIRPDKTMFESLEDWWDWILGFMSPVEKQVDAMRHLHESGLFFGLIPAMSWGTSFIMYGTIVRLITLIPSLYSHRNSLRMQQIGTPLNEIQTNIKRVKADKTLSAEEKKTIQAGYKRMKNALEKKHGGSQTRSMAQMATAPLMMTAFWAVGRMTSYEQSLEVAPYLWVTDLTMPDPTMGLPLLCAASFVLNFELTQRLQKGGRSSMNLYLRWGLRVGVVGFTWYFNNQPAALFLYWLGTSLGGAVQPILLRNQAFRKYFDFPDPPAAGKLELEGVRAPTFWDKMTKSKEKVDEMSRIHSTKLKEAGQVKLMHIDDFEIIVDKKATGATVTKKAPVGKASTTSTSSAPKVGSVAK